MISPCCPVCAAWFFRGCVTPAHGCLYLSWEYKGLFVKTMAQLAQLAPLPKRPRKTRVFKSANGTLETRAEGMRNAMRNNKGGAG
jgi:hypothetical protein